MNTVIPEEKRDWLLKTAWKKFTLKEIALELNVNVTNITQIYKRHGIEPVRKRDRIASQLLDLINTGEHENKSMHDLAILFDCSYAIIKEIVTEYKLELSIRKYTNGNQKNTTISESRMQAAKQRDQRILDMRKERAKLAVYTQSSSQLIDDCRGLKTTLRPKTFLTNDL